LNFSKYNINSPDQERNLTSAEPNKKRLLIKNNSTFMDDFKGYNSTNGNSLFFNDSNEMITSKNFLDKTNTRRQSFDSTYSNINNSNYSLNPSKLKYKFGNESNFHLPQSPSTNLYTSPLNYNFSPTNNNISSHKSNLSLNSAAYNTIIYGDREPEHENDIEGFISPLKSEHIYTFSPKNVSDNFDTASFTSKMSKVTYANQSICTPDDISLTDNCPYYYSDELQGLDDIIDFIEKKFLRVDGEMRAFILNIKTLKEKQVNI